VKQFLILVATILVLVTVGLMRDHKRNAPPSGADVSKPLPQVVSLRDRSTLVAEPGTVGRDIIDWFGDKLPTSRYFELGGHEYDGSSVVPTIEGQDRLYRLTAMLRSEPDVSARIVGYASSAAGPAANQALSEQRARWVVDALAEDGVPRSRLSFEGRGSANPVGDPRSPAERAANERVALVLTTR
jgi:outer membrane protein OmpA-like peptidoglycan-associated protein